MFLQNIRPCLEVTASPHTEQTQSEAGARARLVRGRTGPGQPELAGHRRPELRAPHSPGSSHRGQPHLIKYDTFTFFLKSSSSVKYKDDQDITRQKRVFENENYLKYFVLRRCFCLTLVPHRGWV